MNKTCSFDNTTHRRLSASRLHLRHTAEVLNQRIKEPLFKGLSYDHRYRRFLISSDFQDDDFVVSLMGCERVYLNLPTALEIQNWLEIHSAKLAHVGNFIGGWMYQNRLFLDISNTINGLSRALRIAQMNDQIAIFHPRSGKSITIGELPIEVPA